MDILKSNLGICESIIVRFNAWQGWPDGRGTNTYAVPREHASQSGQYWIPIKEVHGPNGKVLMSDIINRLTAPEVASVMNYDALVAEGAIPVDSI